MSNLHVGEKRTFTEIASWHECEVCRLPAAYRLTFILRGGRQNPASTAYNRDDCGWCSDLDKYACRKHQMQLWVWHGAYESCASFQLKHFRHMGFYWRRVKDIEGSTKT